jgi:UDP-N-acetylglucosamine 2-epimerase (non-hydrolysing)
VKRLSIALVVGTRPEAIKMAPVMHELQRRQEDFEPIIISTGQHRQMLDSALGIFGLQPQVDLQVMLKDQTLDGLTARVLEKAAAALEQLRPDCVAVQGDTTTALAASMAALYRRIPVVHVEAGLRSGDMDNPYPEEANRKMISSIANIHFVPTNQSRGNLLREGIPADRIVVTGNTVVDAMHSVVHRLPSQPLPALQNVDLDSRFILVTTHRRESWGQELNNVCFALRDLISSFPDLNIVFPVHLNPKVGEPVKEILGGHPRIHLLPPLDYVSFVQLMQRCHFVMTDSGGIQEEAPSFGKPVLVMRQVTERPEAAEAGIARIVGTSRTRLVEEAAYLLSDSEAYRRMSSIGSPYGDGKASERIAASLTRWHQGKTPLLEEWDQFGGIPIPEIAAV